MHQATTNFKQLNQNIPNKQIRNRRITAQGNLQSIANIKPQQSTNP